MFGYVRPASEYLTEEQAKCFQSAYCGLCHALGRRYGSAGRMILNYDFAFLAMLLSDHDDTKCRKRCVMHPVKGRPCTCGNAFDLAADMSVILTWWQLQDGISDHGFWSGLPYRAAALLLRRSYRDAKSRCPRFDKNTSLHLQALSRLEKERCASIDAAADTFAQLLSDASEEVAQPVKRRVLSQMLYHLGRWIYLIDAADDLQKDRKTGSYNPLPLRYALTGDMLTEDSRRELAQTLDASIRSMATAFELGDFGLYTPVIESVVYHGLYAVGTAVLDGTFHRKNALQKKGGHPYA